MSESDFDEIEYQRECEIINAMFPNVNFYVSINLEEMDEIVSKEDVIIIKCTFHCYCYQDTPRVNDYILVRNIGTGITIKDMINSLSENNFDPKCNHRFLEGFDKINYITYEANFGS